MATAKNAEQAIEIRKLEDELKSKKDLFNKELQILGSNDIKTLTTENEIALLYLQSYQYSKALLYFKEVYYKRMCVLGPNNLDTIATQINIGMIYCKQGRPDEALKIFFEIYRRRCDILGHKHPDTQEVLRNIGIIWKNQKKYTKAFEIFNELEDSINFQEAIARSLYNENDFEKALKLFTIIKEKVLQKFGPEAPETLTAKYHIGEVLAKLSRWEEVLPIYEEVLEGRKRSLDPFHGNTLSALCNYGVALYKLGNVEKALEFLHKAHQTAKNVSGSDNESSLSIRSAIGYILRSEGRYYESLQVYYDMLRIQTSNNPNHAKASNIQLTIANIYFEQGKENEAYKMYSDVYQKIEDSSPKKSSILNKIVSILMKQGKGEEFIKMRKESYEELKEVLGSEDPITLSAYENLGEAHFYLKELGEALEVFSSVFSKRKVIFGIDRTDTLRTRQRVADTLAMQHDYAEATRIYKEIRNVRKAPLPFTNYAYYILTNLAGLLCLQEQYTESMLAYEERASMSVIMYDPDGSMHALLNDDNGDNRVFHKFERLLEETVSTRSPGHATTLEIQNAVAEILHGKKLYDDALKVYEKVYQLRKTQPSLEPDDPSVVIAKYNVGNMYYCLGRFDEAVEILGDVHTRLNSSLGPEHPIALDTQLQFAEALCNTNQLDAAISHYLDIYWKTKRKLGLKHPVILKCERGLRSVRTKLPKSKLVDRIMEGDFHSFLTCLEEEKESVNKTDTTGYTPLHYASQRGHIDFARRLLKSGAFYDVKDKIGKKPLDYASDNDVAILLLTFENFFVSVQVGDDDSISKLIANDILIDAKDENGNTGLHHASREGHINIVKILLESGADWSSKNEKGELPIDVAISTGNSEIADILGKLSKTDNYRLSKLMNENGGDTPLHLSARKGHLEILQELLRCGADPTDVNDHGYTPLHLAAYEGNTEIAEALLKFVKSKNVKELVNFVSCKNFVDGAEALEIASNRGFTDITKILANYGADDLHS